MKIWKIASVFPAELDDKYYEAAKKVISNKRLVLEMAEEYRLDAHELGDWVLRLYRTPVDNVLEIVDNKDKKTIKEISKRTNSSVNDVVWLLRRLRPNVRMQTTEEEKQQIIDLKKEGLSNKKISEKTRICEFSVFKIVKKNNPELLRSQNVSTDLLDKLYIEYLYLIDEGKTHDDAVAYLLEENKRNINFKELIGGFRQRGLDNNDNKMSYEEKVKFILKEIDEGKTYEEIAEYLTMSPLTIRNIVRKARPDPSKSRRTRTPAEEQVIEERYQKGDKVEDIAKDLNRAISFIYNVINRKNISRPLKDNFDFPIKEIKQEKIEYKKPTVDPVEQKQAQDRYNQLILQEKAIQEKIPGYISKQRENLEKALKGMGIMTKAYCLNWYKIAKTNWREDYEDL